MPIRLFDGEGAYTKAGNNLDLELGRALRPFFARDHSPREVLAVLAFVATAETALARRNIGRRNRGRPVTPQGPVMDVEVRDVEEE